MKKFNIAVTAVLASALMAGSTCIAAPSPSPDTSITIVEPCWLVKNIDKSIAGVKIGTDYSDVTDPTYKATVVQANPSDPATSALMNYVNAQGQAKKAFGAYKIRMYNKGTNMWDGFGTFSFYIGVGNAFDGQTAHVYQIHKDGSITVTNVVVSQGKVKVSAKDLGTFYVTI